MAADSKAGEASGTVLEELPRLLFRVELEGRRQVLCHVSGQGGRKMRRNFVRLLPGYRVRVEISPRDSGRGRIVARETAGERAARENA